ncbi:hypothetical protein DV515_00013578 [Chloebia gouldiae]|uniref:Uncharacterized protein n=1 Tax=Chloebia gouldiae TaxID=44316 RepID=A0A3L8S1I7_CHLGU|nr:hypothetical protein DV515_00013578 [Chloebia gouldiae]
MQEETQKAAVEQPMRTSSWTILLQGVMNHPGHPGSKLCHHDQRSSKITMNGDDANSPSSPHPPVKKYGQVTTNTIKKESTKLTPVTCLTRVFLKTKQDSLQPTKTPDTHVHLLHPQFGWCREALPYQQRSSLAVGQGWKCGGADIPGQEENRPFHPSLLPSFPASLPPLPRREAVSLCERAQRGRKKRNCPSSSAEPRGLSAEDATAYEESEAH